MEQQHLSDPKNYTAGLKKIRFRRLLLWLVIGAYLPAMTIALESPDYRRWAATVFVSWILLLIFFVGYACLARCPRCKELFHTHGPTFLPLRRCLHCALHVNADKRPPEEDHPRARFPKKK